MEEGHLCHLCRQDGEVGWQGLPGVTESSWLGSCGGFLAWLGFSFYFCSGHLKTPLSTLTAAEGSRKEENEAEGDKIYQLEPPQQDHGLCPWEPPQKAGGALTRPGHTAAAQRPLKGAQPPPQLARPQG